MSMSTPRVKMPFLKRSTPSVRAGEFLSGLRVGTASLGYAEERGGEKAGKDDDRSCIHRNPPTLVRTIVDTDGSGLSYKATAGDCKRLMATAPTMRRSPRLGS